MMMYFLIKKKNFFFFFIIFFSIGFVTIHEIFFLKANLTTSSMEVNILLAFLIDG